MANSLVDLYRKDLASRGLVDPRPDAFVTYDLGQAAQQSNPSLFDQFPDFKIDWEQVREANAPSLAGEAGRALKAGTQELASTAAGLGALATGSDYLKGKAAEFQSDAAQNAPTIPSMGDIGGVKDAARYGISKVAGAIPSLAEGVGLAAAGGAFGSALGPEGTVAGAAEGAAEEFLGKGIVKSAIKRLIDKQGEEMVASKLIPEATETAVSDAIKAGNTDLMKAVQTEADAISARRGLLASNALNMYGLNAGAMYNETGKRGESVVAAIPGSLPAMVVPEIVGAKLYPGVAKAVGDKLGGEYVTRLATEALKDAGVLGSAMALQETANVISKNIAAGKDATDITDDDWKRIREAAVGGALTGPLLSPLTAADNAEAFNPAGAKTRSEAARAAAAARVLAPEAPVGPEVPETAAEPTVRSPAARVAIMSDEEKSSRLSDLTSRQGDLTPDEQQEQELLQAFAPKAAPEVLAPDQTVTPETPPAIEQTAAVPPESQPEVLPPAQEEPPAAGAPAPQDFVLPKELSGAKPRYQDFKLQFESDLDRAAYILAQKKPSARDADYLDAVTSQTGMTEDEARAHGQLVKDQIKQLAKGPNDGETLQVPSVAPAIEQPPIEESAPIPAVSEAPQEPAAIAPADQPGEPAALPTAEPVPTIPAPATPEPASVVPDQSQLPAEASPAVESPPVTPELPAAPTPLASLPSVPESPTLEQRLRDELNKPEPFSFGKIDESKATVDLHDDPRFADLTGEQVNRLPVENWSDDTGNKSRTRVSVTLEAPDGHYVVAGILPSQETSSIGGAGERGTGPIVQSMAADTRSAGKYQKVLREGGKRPALLSDLIDAGYKLRGIVHFDEDPGTIFQRFSNRQAYDTSYAASEKSTGTAAQKVIPALTASEGTARKNIIDRQSEIQSQIDSLAKEHASATPDRAAEINDEIKQLYDQQKALPEPRMMTEAQKQPPALPLSIESDRTQQFSAAVAAAKQAGLKVDVLTRGILHANIEDELNRQMDVAQNRYAGADPSEQDALKAKIDQLQEKLDAVNRVRGVAYTPWHIALGLDNVQNQNLNGLVALIHEVGHTILGRSDPEMQGRIMRAVNAALEDLSSERQMLEAQTGVREANLSDPEELLVSTMAQRLAAEGVPESQSLARAIVQWVKDLYYRLAMGVQAAFGREPDPQLALDWFENQLRRTIGGDYDYRFAGIFDRFQPEMPSQAVVRYERSGGTPGSVSDFYDSLSERVRQPQVLPDTRESVDWNMKFMADDKDVGKELDIPAPEANARIMGAAINQIKELTEKAFSDIQPKVLGGDAMTFDEFWTLTGFGDTPKTRLADLEQKVLGSGSAVIDGDRMTDPMNQLARLEAKKLLYKARDVVVSRDAQKSESGTLAEAKLVDSAKMLNKIEGNLRNAEMHDSTLRDSLKTMIRDMARGVRRGLDTAFAAGRLAQSVREVEGLSERDPIPKEYQRVFKAVLADEIPVFHYLDSIAKLDLPLHEMTLPEIMSAIEDAAATDNVLEKLMEPKNKPLLVALAALSKKESVQMDLIQMRSIKDPKDYLALKNQLDEIRTASPAKFKELEKSISEGRKAATFADRIKQNAIKARAKLRRYQNTIREADVSREILGKVRTALDSKITDIETGGLAAPSEWTVEDGKYLAMSQDKDGHWRSTERTLEWTPEGPATNPDQILSDMASNNEYLRSKSDKQGSKTYQMVKRMTEEISMRDVLRSTPEIKRVWLEKFMLPSVKLLASGGGRGGAEVEQMLNKFHFNTNIKSWHSDFEIPAAEWASKLKRATEAAGMKDQKAFLTQIRDPILYLLGTEPGLDEGPALRTAVQAAKRRLTSEPAPAFDEIFKDFLRHDKAMSDRAAKFSSDIGNAVQDDKLGELRPAIPRGWVTVMRSMNSATVSTILRDMGDAGWKMVFKDAKTDVKSVKTLDQGIAAKERVVGAASFDKLLPSEATNDADAEARSQVMESPDAFAKAISGFFTPGIIQRWLEPFINKPGESVFKHAGEDVDPLDVQQAWQEAGGDVAKWIDNLGERVGLEKLIDLGDEVLQGDLGLEAQWRVEMLKQLDSLFLMESRAAADANQVKGLFDAESHPPHLIMNSRENDLLPPEHVQHASFDPISTRNLLATLAFHASFGRNGEAMNKAIASIESGLNAKKAAFDSIASQHNTKTDREQAAKALGYEYNDLKRATSIYKTVKQGHDALKAQFGFNASASMMNDVRGGLALLHFVASQVVNNPKTGLLNLLQPAQRALARQSIGAATIRDTAGAYGEIGKSFFGSTLEAFGIHLLRASQHALDIGSAQGVGYGRQPWTVIEGAASGPRGENLSPAIKSTRLISAAQRRGRLGFGESREFPTLQALPVVNNVMHGIGLAAGISNGTVEARAIESLVRAAMDHFAANPDNLSDPTYRLTHGDIGAYSRALKLDKASFDYLTRKMVEYNIGPLDGVARAAMDRQTRGEPILTKDQVLKASQISLAEVDLQSSIITNPALWDTHPGLKLITPLLGWPIRQMNQVHEAMRNAEGRATVLQAMKTLGILATWSLPVGLAFTFLTDQYDDKILRKKTNMGRVEPLALIPGIGAPLALATSDIPAKEQLLAMFQRLSRAGNIYGLAFDAVSQMLSGLDPTSGQRQFSLDGRVLAFSQFLNLQQTFTNWFQSGFATTYANVERPLIQALVGGGPLQAMDVIGNVLGIDNQEMRIAQRTNVSQWLRAAGREVGVELRRGGGGSVAPTPTSVWTREMYLAALAGDRLDFMDSYRRAVDAARDAGEAKPEAKVLESWRSRNPIEVFSKKPDSIEMARVLGAMNDDGREAVTSALRLYKQYTDLIAPTPEQQYERRQLSEATRLPRTNLLRANLASELAGGFSYR